VRSALPEHAKAAGRKSTRYKWSGARQTDYPLLFRRTGKGSKHKRVFVPSNDERLQVVEMMQSDAATPFVAHRNVLIVDIASATGLRRASINSLRVDQFGQTARGEFVYVVPKQQKFSYEDSFAFPTWLYLRVQQYIKDYLLPMSKSRGWLDRKMGGRLFLSSRDGRPLEDRTLTQIVAQYMRRALDAPPGTAVHAFRHRFINVAIMDELRYRLAAGLDTSTDAITASVGMRVGHKNLESIRPYVIHLQSFELARKGDAGEHF
jgi:integrase